ncbi:MAG TPA: methyltransferase domain-containing protein [Pyrinomonadaceae bacterium]|nr:methyltransferase domain-containing protein [Pyrinomonadaceae bacterium]
MQMSIADKISHYNRQRKWRTFTEIIRPSPDLKVLDVGYCNQETVETDNFIEKHYPHPRMLTALGTEAPTIFRDRYPEVNCIQYDGTTFPFRDGSFDVCWSNAVIEHVGDRAAQLRFLREISRVARRAFITTPNKFFPIEVHTRTPLLHLLPKPVFESYLRRIGKAWATGEYMNLLSLSELKQLLHQAGIHDFRILKNKLLGFTLDFVVIMNLTDDRSRLRSDRG